MIFLRMIIKFSESFQDPYEPMVEQEERNDAKEDQS